jgi:hypothetical protein
MKSFLYTGVGGIDLEHPVLAYLRRATGTADEQQYGRQQNNRYDERERYE